MPSWFVIVVRSVQIGLPSLTDEHLGLGGDLVARAHRRAEVPVDVEEHAAGTGQVLGNERVEQTGRHPALHDDAAEAACRGSGFVVVQRVAVTGDLGEQLDVASADLSGASSGLADVHHVRLPQTLTR